MVVQTIGPRGEVACDVGPDCLLRNALYHQQVGKKSSLGHEVVLHNCVLEPKGTVPIHVRGCEGVLELGVYADALLSWHGDTAGPEVGREGGVSWQAVVQV